MFPIAVKTQFQEEEQDGNQVQQIEVLPQYAHIERNDFLYRKHKKQKEEDIAICECRYEPNDVDSACGERCLNVLTSTECTPGYCPCGEYCKNQRFQKCEYAMFKLFKTEGRGWGLLAADNIKAGKFIVEYCGEVISWKEARRRSQAYEAEGLKDAFIISLNAYESIDATRKGSLARFINHSCEPNCETRKWTVLGEIRVGIFAKQDILAGTELAYDYNFEWYGGAKVRCRCGASLCSGFLGAKSRGFQEDTYLWEDDDDRYSVENIPLYDSEEDEQTSKLLMSDGFPKDVPNAEGKSAYLVRLDYDRPPEDFSQSEPIVVEPLNSILMEDAVMDEAKIEINKDKKIYPRDAPKVSGGRSRHSAQKQFDAKVVTQLLSSKEAQDDVFSCKQAKDLAASRLTSLYNEIRPAIEEHEKDSQDCVSTSVAEKWIEASCCKIKAEFNLYSTIIKHISRASQRTEQLETPLEVVLVGENNMEYLEVVQ